MTSLDLHPILCTWDAVITCYSSHHFLPLGVYLYSKNKVPAQWELSAREGPIRPSGSGLSSPAPGHVPCVHVEGDQLGQGKLHKLSRPTVTGQLFGRMSWNSQITNTNQTYLAVFISLAFHSYPDSVSSEQVLRSPQGMNCLFKTGQLCRLLIDY